MEKPTKPGSHNGDKRRSHDGTLWQWQAASPLFDVIAVKLWHNTRQEEIVAKGLERPFAASMASSLLMQPDCCEVRLEVRSQGEWIQIPEE